MSGFMPLSRIARASARLLLVTLCCLLATCSSTPVTAVRSIQIVAELSANNNLATAIDIVFAYDETAVGMLPKTGPDWFDNKTILTSGLAKSIDVVTLQIPPATIVEVKLPSRYRKAIGVYSYANYLNTDGQQQINLTPYKNMTLWLTPSAVACKCT